MQRIMGSWACMCCDKSEVQMALWSDVHLISASSHQFGRHKGTNRLHVTIANHHMTSLQRKTSTREIFTEHARGLVRDCVAPAYE